MVTDSLAMINSKGQYRIETSRVDSENLRGFYYGKQRIAEIPSRACGVKRS